MNNPVDAFFKLGEKATKGDPEKMQLFNYLMLWIIFVAFIMVFVGNLLKFLNTMEFQFLGWSAFGLAILWFQYNALATMHNQRKLMKKDKKETKPLEIESLEDIKKQFEVVTK